MAHPLATPGLASRARRRFLELASAAAFGSWWRPGAAVGQALQASALGGPKAAQGSALVRARLFSSSRAARLVVVFSAPSPFRLQQSPAGGLVELVMPGCRDELRRLPRPSAPGMIERIDRESDDAAARLRIRVAPDARCQLFALQRPFRLVLDVYRPDAAAGAVAAFERGGPRPVGRVVLDPGHGGEDVGAVGPSGLREKDVALDIAHRAAPLLARELNIDTLLTRSADTAVTLEQRVAQANDFGADLFISIHCNAHRSRTAQGVYSFVLAPGRDPAANALAALENALEPSVSPGREEHEDRLAGLFNDPRLARSSLRLAELLQRATVSSLAVRYPDTVDGGVLGAGFYVLAGALMPAVLFETSFISNHREESRLFLPDYRQKLADGIVNAVRAYSLGR